MLLSTAVAAGGEAAGGAIGSKDSLMTCLNKALKRNLRLEILVSVLKSDYFLNVHTLVWRFNRSPYILLLDL